MTDDATPIRPGPGHCVRESGNSWDEEPEEGPGDACESSDPIDATARPDLETPCVISFEEDYD
jgi:hypothetical protein